MPKRIRGFVPEDVRNRINLENESERQEDHLCRLIQNFFKTTTVKEFAEKSGVSPGSVQKFKTDPFEMNFKVLLKCCVAAGIVLGVVNDE